MASQWFFFMAQSREKKIKGPNATGTFVCFFCFLRQGLSVALEHDLVVVASGTFMMHKILGKYGGQNICKFSCETF